MATEDKYRSGVLSPTDIQLGQLNFHPNDS